jgi:hypothetical protein
MIKFFRKIRQKTLTENKFGKYMTYAIGEIVLVVIGILIALQVNNWNEQRKLNNETDKFTQVLNSEFSDNRIVLKERIKDLDQANNYVKTVLSFMNKDNIAIQKTNIDSIISKSLKYGNYNPANSTIRELISSGKLNLITDDSLKKNLFNWLQLLEDSDEDFKNQDQQATTLLIPYLYKNISMQNLNAYNNMGIQKNSELFNRDYNQVFHDIQFENLYQGKLFWNTIMLNHYKELDTLALKIINQTEKKK